MELELSDDRKTVLLSIPPTARVTVTGTSKKHKQAVLQVTESDRVFLEEDLYVDFYYCPSLNTYAPQDSTGTVPPSVYDKDVIGEDAYEAIEGAIEGHRSYSEGSTFVIKSICTTSSEAGSPMYVDIEVHAPADKFSMLIGVDENHSFICRIAEMVSTVAEAHEALRPAEVREDAYRIGEYFFQPLTDEEHEYFAERFFQGHRNLDRTFSTTGDIEFYDNSDNYWSLGAWDKEESCFIEIGSGNHRAVMSWEVGDVGRGDRRVFVMGKVYDTENRHEPVFFPYITEVFRNNEVLNTSDRWD